MLVRSGIYLIKYWFSVNDEEQERRFRERMQNPIKRWKLSPMDVESRERWVEYSQGQGRDAEAHRQASARPGTSSTPTTRRSARLNCIAHLLQQIPYKDLRPVQIELPPRQPDGAYIRPKKSSQRWVKERY